MVFHHWQLSNLFGQLSTYSTLLYQKSVRYGSSRFKHPTGKFRQFASVWSTPFHHRRRAAHEDFPLDLRRMRHLYLFIIQCLLIILASQRNTARQTRPDSFWSWHTLLLADKHIESACRMERIGLLLIPVLPSRWFQRNGL